MAEITTLIQASEIICPICREVLTEPQLTECCGHICGNCVNIKWQLRSNTPQNDNCPYRTSTVCRYILDRHFQRELNALEVHCTQTVAGCVWKGEMGNLAEHLKDCPIVYIKTLR